MPQGPRARGLLVDQRVLVGSVVKGEDETEEERHKKKRLACLLSISFSSFKSRFCSIAFSALP
jgi:hypothetical protein